MIHDHEIREVYSRLGAAGKIVDIWIVDLASGTAIRTKPPRADFHSVYAGRFQRRANKKSDISPADFVAEIRHCINLLERRSAA